MTDKICNIPECSRSAKARGMCSFHYERWRCGIPFDQPERAPGANLKKCELSYCDENRYGNGYCQRHWYLDRNNKPLDTPRRVRNGLKCRFEECEKVSKTRGYCPAHYRQLRVKGELNLTVIRAPGQWGSWTTDGKGDNKYIRRWRLNEDGTRNHQYQHRFVMEESIGRPLLKSEDVHHLNGDRSDNRIENLELWSHSQPRGQRIPDKVEWAKEILEQYAPELLK